MLKKVKNLSIILILFLVFAITVNVSANEIILRYGSGAPTTSSGYPGHMKLNEVVDNLPGISSTFVGIGASEAVARGIYDGDLDWGGMWGLNVYYESTNGLGKWEGNKKPNILRVMCITYEMAAMIVVSEKSGINSISDLEGKKFSLGIPGSTSQNLGAKSFEALGVNIEPFIGSLQDAVEAFKDGRIAGFLKDSPAQSLDAGILDAMTSVPIKILSFTKEEMAKIQEKYPYISFKSIPAGYYSQLPELEEINVLSAPLGVGISKDIPDEVVYQMVKTLVDNWEILVEAWKGFATFDPLNTPKVTSVMENVYLHPGAIRFFKEKGVDIPDSVIPPEAQ